MMPSCHWVPESAAGSREPTCGRQEEIARRLKETQRLMARFGQENERLASEISRMRSGGAGAGAAPGDYKGAVPRGPC